MLNTGISICTNEADIVIRQGPNEIKEQRELALASMKYVLTDICDLKRSFFSLGFHLYEIAEMKYYEDFGYGSMLEFCEANFDMDKSSVSRCIHVYLHVCQRSDDFTRTPLGFIKDQYAMYSYSQLCEMISMDKNMEKCVRPDMTIQEIRDLKRSVPFSASFVRDFLIEIMCCDRFSRDDCEKQMKEYGSRYHFRSGSFCGGAIKSYSFKPGCLSINDSGFFKFSNYLNRYESEYSFSVATSQPSILNLEQLRRLSGAALSAHLKKVIPVGTVSFILCDSDGVVIHKDACDVLLNDGLHVVFRLCGNLDDQD